MSETAANVDPAELQKFSDLASRWWDPLGAFRPLHALNPARMEWLERHVSPGGLRVLDVGCGGGILSEALSAKGAEVLGIDLAGKPLQVARLHALETGARVEYQAIAAEDIAAERPGEFDLVTCMEMLEHVPDPASTVRACATLVKPGGWVMVSTLNRNLRSWLLAIVGAEYVMRLLPRGTHEHRRFLKPSEVARAGREAGLEVADVIGMHYDPFRHTVSLVPDVSVNYLMAFRRPAAR